MKEKKLLDEKDVNIRFNVLAIILIIIFCFAMSPVTLQNDTFYTVKIGEHIMENGIDMKDPFSWHEDLDYTYPHWLYDVITYLIYSAFGMMGIYITTCILACILGVLIYRVNCKIAKNKVLSFVITLGVIYLIRGYIAARAQLVTFILFILTIYFIEKFLETQKKRYAIGLIIIPIMIANLHAAVFPFYFVLYLPYIAEYIIAVIAENIIYRKRIEKGLIRKIKKLSKKDGQEEKVQELKKKLEELQQKVEKIKLKRQEEIKNPYKIKLKRNDNVKWLIVIMIICVFTGLLTPIGTTPYTYLVKTMQGNTTQNINEHLPMTLGNETAVLCTLVLFLAVLIFTDTKIRLCDLFMIVGLAYLMLVSRRQLSMFAIIGSLVLNKLVYEMIQRYQKDDIIGNIERVFVSRIGMFLVASIVILLSYHFAKPKFNDKFIDERSYPVAACDYILENINLEDAKFYNEYNYGSYMLFRGIPVFIDSRADLYAPEFSGKEDDIFMDFINTSNIGVFYEETFEKYGITHVITYKNSKMNMIIVKTQDENYKELYADDYFVIYERINS